MLVASSEETVFAALSIQELPLQVIKRGTAMLRAKQVQRPQQRHWEGLSLFMEMSGTMNGPRGDPVGWDWGSLDLLWFLWKPLASSGHGNGMVRLFGLEHLLVGLGRMDQTEAGLSSGSLCF